METNKIIFLQVILFYGEIILKTKFNYLLKALRPWVV